MRPARRVWALSVAGAVWLVGPTGATQDESARSRAVAGALKAAQAARDRYEPGRMAASAHEALSLARELPASHPLKVQALGLNGEIACSSRSSELCERSLQELRSIEPATFGSRLETARVLAAMGRHDEASAEATAALELEPGNGEALEVRGTALLGSGRLERGLADLEASSRSQRSATVHLRLAKGYRMAGDFEKAKSHLEAARKIAPERLWLSIAAGYGRLFATGFDDAESLFRAAVRANPGSAMAHHHLAAALAAAGRRSEAVREYERALRLHRRAPPVRDGNLGHTATNLAKLYQGLGRDDDAQSVLREGIAAVNPGTLSWRNLTTAFARFEGLRRGRPKEADAALARALAYCESSLCEHWTKPHLLLARAQVAAAAGDAAAGGYARSAAEAAAQEELAGRAKCDLGVHFWATLAALHSRGVSEDRAQDQDRAERAFAEALSMTACEPRSPSTGRLHHQLGMRRQAQQDSVAARLHFAAAEEVFADLGDSAQADRMRALKRSVSAAADGAEAAAGIRPVR